MSDLILEELRDLTIPQRVCGTCRHWAGRNGTWDFDEPRICTAAPLLTTPEFTCPDYSWK